MGSPKEVFQAAVSRHILSTTFRPEIAFTWTLEECPFEGDVNYYDQQKLNQQYSFVEGMCKEATARLNQKCFGNRWHKKYKRNPKEVIQVFMVTEISNYGRFHVHGAIELPKIKDKTKAWLMNEDSFTNAINECWGELNFAGKQHNDFRSITNLVGWVQYITKHLYKHNSQGFVSFSNYS